MIFGNQVDVIITFERLPPFFMAFTRNTRKIEWESGEMWKLWYLVRLNFLLRTQRDINAVFVSKMNYIRILLYAFAKGYKKPIFCYCFQGIKWHTLCNIFLRGNVVVWFRLVITFWWIWINIFVWHRSQRFESQICHIAKSHSQGLLSFVCMDADIDLSLVWLWYTNKNDFVTKGMLAADIIEHKAKLLQ